MAIFDRFRRNRPKPKKPVRQRISEIIGRIATNLSVNLRYYARITVDYTQADYEFHDKLRRGLQRGFEIGGLFVRPMSQIITSWTLGDGFSISGDNETTIDAINGFVAEHLQELVETNEDKLALGDSYIVVNGDGSLSRVPPSQVEVEVAEDDIHTITSVTITSHHKGLQIQDRYTDTERTVTTRRASTFGNLFPSGNQIITEETYPNLIGRIPVIHFANDKGSNEVYGHPYHGELLTLLAEYDDVYRKAIDGVKIMGNPIPVVEGLEDPEGAKALNATYSDTYEDLDGNTQTDSVTELDPHTMLYFGKGANFKFAAPGAFTSNTKDMLKKAFQLMLQNAQIPEWVWGGAISSSMASVNAQMPAFARFIGGRRRKLETPLKALIEIYLATIALFTPGIQADMEFSIEWSELVPEDEETKLKWVMFALQNGLITRATALRLADLVDDPNTEIANAEEEAAQDESAFNADIEAAIANLRQQDNEDEMGDDMSPDETAQQNGNRELASVA